MKTLRVAVLCALVVSSATVSVPAFADDGDDWRHHAACDHRVCLYVIDEEDDTDGDGVADIDERYLGTDVFDRLSMPAAQKLIDQMLMRDLPSFESHLTELVVLPQMTTDFSHLATAVGLMDLPSKAWGTTSLPGLFGDLQTNGLAGITAAVGINLPGSGGHDLPDGISDSYFTYMQQVKDGTESSSTMFDEFGAQGMNAGKQGGAMVLSNFSVSIEGGFANVRGETDTSYPDKTKDYSSFTHWTNTQNPNESGSNWRNTSLGSNGENSISKGYSKTVKDPDTGEIVTTSHVETEYYDKDGRRAGNSVSDSKTTIKDGVKTTETTTTTVDTKGHKTVTKTNSEEKCQSKDCSGGMVDPDYVTFGPLTADDYRKVIARIDSIRTPGPDTGILSDNPPQIPTRDIYANYSGDGVVVFSATPNPHFNTAQPEYDPQLQDMAPLAGIGAPNTQTDDPTAYWPDKP
jgi:hypothetical protein